VAISSQHKRSELSNLLRRLADYVDSRPDEELVPLFELAQRLKPEPPIRRRSLSFKKFDNDIDTIVRRLSEQRSREQGEALLRRAVPNREALETLARTLQLPVQRDDDLQRLRAKIVESVIGFRLRSQAIQRR